jgi:ribokinase
MLSPAQIRAFPWDKVDWLLINEGEADALYRGSQGSTAHKDSQTASTTSVKDGVASLLASLDIFNNTNIVCTLGADGVLAYPRRSDGKEMTPVYRPAATLQGDFRDTTGAGDCFTGYFVAGLMWYPPDARLGKDISEDDISRLLEFSNQVSARTGLCYQYMFLTQHLGGRHVCRATGDDR